MAVSLNMRTCYRCREIVWVEQIVVQGQLFRFAVRAMLRSAYMHVRGENLRPIHA